MLSLFTQFLRYICMLDRFTMTQPESFTTVFLEAQPGGYQGTFAHAVQLYN